MLDPEPKPSPEQSFGFYNPTPVESPYKKDLDGGGFVSVEYSEEE